MYVHVSVGIHSHHTPLPTHLQLDSHPLFSNWPQKNKHILRKNHWFHGLPRCVYQKYQHLQTIHWKWVADYFLPGSWSRCETPNLDGLNLRLNRNFMGIHGPFHTHTMTYHHIPIIYFCWLYCMVPIGIPLHNKKTGKSHEIQKKRPHKKNTIKSHQNPIWSPTRFHQNPMWIPVKCHENPRTYHWIMSEGHDPCPVSSRHQGMQHDATDLQVAQPSR